MFFSCMKSICSLEIRDFTIISTVCESFRVKDIHESAKKTEQDQW